MYGNLKTIHITRKKKSSPKNVSLLYITLYKYALFWGVLSIRLKMQVRQDAKGFDKYSLDIILKHYIV